MTRHDAAMTHRTTARTSQRRIPRMPALALALALGSRLARHLRARRRAGRGAARAVGRRRPVAGDRRPAGAGRAAPANRTRAPWHRRDVARGSRRGCRTPRERDDFLATVHYEAMRAGLDPQLVLGVIHHESGFRKYAVSVADARGYMQVMPFWVTLIGVPGPQPVPPAHQPALRLRDPAPLPRPRKRRPVPRARPLQRQPRPPRVPERRRRRAGTGTGTYDAAGDAARRRSPPPR